MHKEITVPYGGRYINPSCKKSCSCRMKGRSDVQIDCKIWPLIKELWKAGFGTEFSCEGTKEIPAYIMFPSFKEVQKFYNVILQDGTIKEKISYDSKWRVEAIGKIRGKRIVWGGVIRFPKRDIKKITEVFKKNYSDAQTK